MTEYALINPNMNQRGEVVKARLADMNPMVKIDLYPTFDVKSFYTTYIKKEGTTSTVGEDFLKAFDIITSSTKSFKEMVKKEQVLVSEYVLTELLLVVLR